MQTRNYITAFIGGFLMLLSTASNAWLVEENFDGQSSGGRCDPFWSDDKDSVISQDKSSSGNKSCKFSINEGGTEWGGGFVFPSALHSGDESWIRFRLFIPQGFDYNSYDAGNRLKFIRVAIRDPDQTVGYLNWYWKQEGNNPIYGGYMSRDDCTTNCWQYFGDSNKPTRGTWETWEMYVKFDHTPVDAGGQGRVRMWKNGNLIGDLTNRPTMWPGSRDAVSYKIFSYWNGTSPATQHLYFDDLVATNVAPSEKDAYGNSYIGVGDYSSVALPKPPASASGSVTKN